MYSRIFTIRLLLPLYPSTQKVPKHNENCVFHWLYTRKYVWPYPLGLFFSSIGQGGGGGWSSSPQVTKGMMHKQCCNSHIYMPTFWARSNGKGFESLRPLQGLHEGLHVSHFRTRNGAPPTLKPNLRQFQSSEIKNKARLLI